MPVLIDFGGVKELKVVKFYKFREITYAVGKERMLQRNSGDRASLPNSDLYALAVTALVLLTGKEPRTV